MTTPRLALALVAPVALGALAGCGDDLAPRLHISAVGSDLLAIDRGGGWEPLALDATGRVTVDLDGPYALVNVCGARRATSARLGGVRAADEDLDLDCVGAAAPTVPVTVTVALTSQEVAAVHIGRAMFLVSADRPRTLDVEPGPADIVVYAAPWPPTEPPSTPPRGGIVRRGVELRAGLALAFDPTTEAIDFVPRAHATPAGDTMQAWWDMAGGGIASLPGDGATIRVPPPAARRPGDTYHAQRSVTDGDLYRTRTVAFDPDATAPIAIELAAPFERVDFATAGPPAATWLVPDAAAWPEATLHAADSDALGNLTASWQVTVDRTARPDEDPAALAMPDVTAIAGWQAAWNLSPTPQRALTVRRPGPGAAEESMTVWRP